MKAHVPPGIIAVILIQICSIPRGVIWIILVGIAGLLVTLDTYRVYCFHQAKRFPVTYRWFTERVEPWLIKNLHLREKERGNLCSIATYSLGLVAVYSMCGDEAALWAALILAFGDPAAGFFGRRFGKHRLSNGKSLEGFLAFVLVGFLSMLIFSDLLQLWWPMSVKLSVAVVAVQLVGVFAGALAELLLPFDNFTIPVVSGVVMQMML